MISKKIREKLNSRGVSVILALAVFLIVAFVSIAIVNASILNARRTQSEKLEEKAYIATTKGISLIQQCMTEDAAYVKKEGKESKLTGMEGTLGEAVREMADSITDGGGSVTRDIGFSYSGLDEVGGSLMGKITMDSDYTITIDTWVDSGKADYPVTLTIPGAAQTVKDDKLKSMSSSNVKQTTYVSWSRDGMYLTSKEN